MIEHYNVSVIANGNSPCIFSRVGAGTVLPGRKAALAVLHKAFVIYLAVEVYLEGVYIVVYG